MSNNTSPNNNHPARKLSPLRKRMIDDMTVRNLSAQTQASYVQYVSQLARYCQTSPEKLGVEDIRTFLLYLANEKGLSPSARNVATHALRFFFLVTLRRSWTIESIPISQRRKQTSSHPQPGGSPMIDRCCPNVHRSCDSQHDVRDRYTSQ
jgi:site-specific recombinase XerD